MAEKKHPLEGVAIEQVEKRGASEGGEAPVEGIVELPYKNAIGLQSELDPKLDPVVRAAILALTPTITFSDFTGKFGDQEFAPPPGKALPAEVLYASFYGQTPYSDATWFLGGFPPAMGLAGLVMGINSGRKKAKEKIDYVSEQAKYIQKLEGALREIVEESKKKKSEGKGDGKEKEDAKESFKEFLREQAQYNGQREVPGQMSGGYDMKNFENRLHVVESFAKRFAKKEGKQYL